VYFQSTRGGGAGQGDIYVARRAVATDPFGAVTAAPGVNTTDNETDPMTSPDELAIYFTSNRPSGMTGVKLWVGTRGSTASPFAGFALVPGVESSNNDGQPFLRADGQELWLTSNRGGASSLIYRAPLADGGFANPVPVDELNSAATQWKPYLTSDGLTAFWSSTRSDGGAKGGHDLWTARRASLTAMFAAPETVAELNTSYNEQMGSVSPDGSRIYFSSDRPGGAGSYDIYEAAR
jgi:Tol biopolymer transport system component